MEDRYDEKFGSGDKYKFGDSMKSGMVDAYLSKTAAILDELESKVRRVRDPEFWGKPYGTPITPGMKPNAAPNKPMTVRIPNRVTGNTFAFNGNAEHDAMQILEDMAGTDIVDYVRNTPGHWYFDDNDDSAIGFQPDSAGPGNRVTVIVYKPTDDEDADFEYDEEAIRKFIDEDAARKNPVSRRFRDDREMRVNLREAKPTEPTAQSRNHAPIKW